MLPNERHFLKPTELSSPVTQVALLLVGYTETEALPLGTAVFIAAGLAMTAKHVVEEFWRQLGDDRPFQGSTALEGNFRVVGVQYPGEEDAPALWLAEIAWGSPFTDVAFLSLKPANPLAEQNIGHNWVKLDLNPPAVGDSIVGFGYAASRATKASEQIRLELHPTTTGGVVTEVYPEYRDRGMLRFPCFAIEAHFIGGMSGGPLFNNSTGAVCGLICSSHEGYPLSYGASLWPAMTTQITHQGNGMVCKGPYGVFELGQVGITSMEGWDKIQPLIEFIEEPFSLPRLRLRSSQ